jgi:hypothetical protein
VLLEHCYRWLASEGALVFVVPAPAVGTCARLLTSQFDRFSVFRMVHPESVRFNQVVVFGRRKRAHLRGDQRAGLDCVVQELFPQSLSQLVSTSRVGPRNNRFSQPSVRLSANSPTQVRKGCHGHRNRSGSP